MNSTQHLKWQKSYLSVGINSIGIHQRLEARCVFVCPGRIQSSLAPSDICIKIYIGLVFLVFIERYLQNLPVVCWVHLIGVNFLDGGREGGAGLVGACRQCALDVWDVCSLEMVLSRV